MTDTTGHAADQRVSNSGLPMRTVERAPEHSAQPATLQHDSPSTGQAHPKRGIRVRVNSLGAAVMLRNNTPASQTSTSSSSQSTKSLKTKTRGRSATVNSSEVPSSQCHDFGPASTSNTPLAPASHPPQPTHGEAKVEAHLPMAPKKVESSASAASSNGINRRKFFGRSNSIRSLLGSKDGATSTSSSSNVVTPSSSHGASSTGPGLLRRMGSRSFLNLNQSKGAAAAVNDSSSDDVSSLTSAESHASRRFSDSLKSIRRRRENSASQDASKTRSLSSRTSSEAYAARVSQNEAVQSSSSRKSIDSIHSGLSATSAEPNTRSSAAHSSGHSNFQPTRELQDSVASTPRRLTGWLYNMVGSDSAASSAEGGAPLSPVREADAIDFAPSSLSPHHHAQTLAAPSQTDAGRSASPTAVATTRSKAGALLQSLASVSSKAGTKVTAATIDDRNAAGSVSGGTNNSASNNDAGTSSNTAINSAAGCTNTGGWVPGGVGFDRAFKFFMDSDVGNKEDEEIWLLGVRHAPRQASKAVSSQISASHSTPSVPAPQNPEASDMSMPRACSPSSSITAASPRQNPLDLTQTSHMVSDLYDHTSIPADRSESRVGSSISMAGNTSTCDSVRTKSSNTSSGIGNQPSATVPVDSHSAFQPDFASRIWCTYRNQFAPIARDGTISDQAASAAEAMAAAQLSAVQDASVPSTPSAAPSSSAAVGSSSPAASTGRGWLGRKTTESNAAQEAAFHANSPLGLGATLGAGYANASSTLGERMGITNLWSRATAAAQAAGFSRAGLTTDSGWGCMLRTGQSLLANALINVHLGRSWLRETLPMRQVEFLEQLASLSLDSSAEAQGLHDWREKRARHVTYVKILSWFLDDPSPACPFGIHRMAREGKRLGKEVGEWFGPSTAAGAIKQLVSEFGDAGIAVELAHDGVFYLDEVRAAAGAATPSKSAKSRQAAAISWRRPVLILVGIRLGLESVNPIYYESVKATFSFPHSVGIAGGRPSSSYYFMGHQGNSLFYLDPHNVRPAVPLRYPPSSFPSAVPRHHDVARRFAQEDLDDEQEWWAQAYTEAQTSTFHCEKVRRMPIKSLDPSMLLGFLVKDEEDLIDLCARIKALPKTIFSFAESAPKWVDDDDFDPSMESFSEPSIGDETEDDGDENNATKATNGGAVLKKADSPVDAQDDILRRKGTDGGASENLCRESQQRTAAWLGQDRPLLASSRMPNADAVGSDGIAFPSLDLLTPQTDGETLLRPSRPDGRQASTSSAATTRLARRVPDTALTTEHRKSRDLIASHATASPHAYQASPSCSPARPGADESFSTVNLSDSEVGSGWEEVSDGGTIAASGSAGPALLRTGSPFHDPSTADGPAAGIRGNADGTRDIDSKNPGVPTSLSSELIEAELVSLSLDTPVGEASDQATYFQKPDVTGSAMRTAGGSASTTEGGQGNFGLTSAHSPLALPRRRSQSKPSPADLPMNAHAEDAPPVPILPSNFQIQSAKGKSNIAPDVNDSDDDF